MTTNWHPLYILHCSSCGGTFRPDTEHSCPARVTGTIRFQEMPGGELMPVPEPRVVCYGCGHIRAHHAPEPASIDTSAVCKWAGCGCPWFVDAKESPASAGTPDGGEH